MRSRKLSKMSNGTDGSRIDAGTGASQAWAGHREHWEISRWAGQKISQMQTNRSKLKIIWNKFS